MTPGAIGINTGSGQSALWNRVMVTNCSSHIAELLKVAVDDDLKRPPHFRDETDNVLMEDK